VLAFHVADKELKPSDKLLPKPRPGWALIRVHLAGICNTDVEILRGYHAFRGTPGHEFVGEVADVHGVSCSLRKKWLRRRVVGEINVVLGLRLSSRLCFLPARIEDALRAPVGVGHREP
jgi:alcohol dehydrogenase